MSWLKRIEKSLIAGLVIIVVVSFSLVVLKPAVRDAVRDWEYQQGIKELKKIDYDYKDLRDPTYYEMEEFLARDKTDSDKPGFFDLWDVFPCVHFAGDVKRNAIAENIRCGGVIIGFVNPIITDFLKAEGVIEFNYNRKHVLVVFQTTDKGIIFIEPQTDEEVEVAVGVPYRGNIINTISEIEVYWPK